MNKLKGDFGNTLTSSGTGVPENSSGNSGNMESGETNKEDDWDNVLDGCGTAYMVIQIPCHPLYHSNMQR